MGAAKAEGNMEPIPNASSCLGLLNGLVNALWN